MKKLISLTLALVMIVACLAGLAVAADPIATVDGVDVTTNDELLAAIQPTGKSVVVLKANVTAPRFNIPYTCTIDLNGFTLKGTEGNGINISALGSENTVTTIKNGVVEGQVLGIRINGGSAIVDNVKCMGYGSAAFGSYALEETTCYLKNSVFVSKAMGAVSFNHADGDQSKHTIDIVNCDIITIADSNPAVLVSRTPTPGTYNLGKNVNLYTYKVDGYGTTKANYTGEAVNVVEGLHKIEVPEFKGKYTGMALYATAEGPIEETPAEPETPATPSVPGTTTPDVEAPATGVSIAALGMMAVVSAAGAAFVARKKD